MRLKYMLTIAIMCMAVFLIACGNNEEEISVVQDSGTEVTIAAEDSGKNLAVLATTPTLSGRLIRLGQVPRTSNLKGTMRQQTLVPFLREWATIHR